MIYADYNGSAPICEDVHEYLLKRLKEGVYANPNAIHKMGRTVMDGMENARRVCAKALGVKPKQIIFNSGSTEGISQIFYSVLSTTDSSKKPYIIISSQEHSAINNNALHYENQGFKTLKINSTSDGLIDLDHFQTLLNEHMGQIAFVSTIAANNESGVIQPFDDIGKKCESAGIPFFCDTTQLIGKAPFKFSDYTMDYAVMSGHKIGALMGTGLIIAKDVTTLKPQVIGGGQEKGIRGGTQNYLGNETMAVALNTFEANFSKVEALKAKRESFEKKLKEKFPELVIIGENAPRLASTTYLAYPGIHGQAVQIELESNGIFVTTSSACSDNEPVTSKVLKSIGVCDNVGRGALRISLGLCAKESYYDTIFENLSNAYEKLSKIKSF